MTAPQFKAGDKVRVEYMGATYEATVVKLLLVNERPHKRPCYRLELPGVKGQPSYFQDEMEAV